MWEKKYCIYGLTHIRNTYNLIHPTKGRSNLWLNYDYSDPKNIFITSESQKKLDSLILIEGYNIDTTSIDQRHLYTIRIAIDGDCQYCDYYKSINPRNYCEPYKE